MTTTDLSAENARAAVQFYLDGAQQGRGDLLEAAFYSSTNLHSIDDAGRLEIVARDRFVAFAGGGNLPPHSSRIVGCEEKGDIAWATVEFDLPDRKFFDVLSLLKLDVGWRIVSKSYSTTMKSS